MFLYQQQQQLCYTIGNTIFALAWRVQPCFAALLCACLFAHDCEYTRTHAHTTRKYTHTHIRSGTNDDGHTSRSGFVVFVRIRRMRCRRPFCVHVCERQCRRIRRRSLNSIQHKYTHTPNNARTPKTTSLSFSLSIFCTHAYTPNGCNCVRAVRACVLITLAYVLALNTDCQKSNCTE